jgi:hypothetical protein
MSTSFDAVPDAVRRALSAQLGAGELQIVADIAARMPTGEAVRYVAAVDPAKPNSVASTTVGADGTLRPRAELEALAGRPLFLPPFIPGFERPIPVKAPVTIDPKSNDWTLVKCARFTETVTVTVPPTGAVPKADVYLLADTTGSMEPILAAVQAGANAILNHPGLVGFDVAWGVGNYRDFPVATGLNSYAFQPQLAPTANHAAVTAAIGDWAAAEGSDIPEGQLNALQQLATDPGIGWRSDAKRIVVWFGDAPGHDPICSAISGLPADVTEGTATAALVAANTTVVAVSTVTGTAGALDGDPSLGATDYSGPCAIGGAAGQATRITAATGGSHTTGIDADSIVVTLGDLIATAVAATGSVTLVASGATAAFVESISPSGGYGPLAGDEEHVLTFEVTWVGTRPCMDHEQDFTGSLDVMADGVIVAQKPVHVRVPACRYHHVVEFLCGDYPEHDKGCDPVVAGSYETVVTIYNPLTCPVVVEKRFAPVVRENEPVGREPKTIPARPFARIELAPGEATMDDCCALREAVGSINGLLVGVLDIVASAPLEVSVVHTTRTKSSGPAITARSISPRRAA